MFKMRFRNWFMLVGGLVTLLAGLLLDPDMGLITALPWGASTLAQLVVLSQAFWYIALLHFARKAIADYIDLEAYFKKALGSAEGAGMALVGVGLMMVALAAVIYTAVHR